MKKQFFFFILLAYSLSANAQKIKAFVGGTLIDGFGGIPIYNSVIIIENERIKTVGTVGSTTIPKRLYINVSHLKYYHIIKCYIINRSLS